MVYLSLFLSRGLFLFYSSSCFHVILAELKLSAVFKIEDFAQENARVRDEDEACNFLSGELPQLKHSSLPGLQWEAQLCTLSPNEQDCKNGFAGFFLHADFGTSNADARYVWGNYSATVLDADGSKLARMYFDDAVEFSSEGRAEKHANWGYADAFKAGDVKKAVQKDGSLCVRIDLTILKIGEILKCRKLLRGLLANNTHSDFDVKVGNETFKLHKSVLGESSSYFSSMLQSGMEEAAEGALTLPDTTPAAFKAFSEAIYFDNWDFLSDTDLTQAVLHLAEKFDIGTLKSYCDESLAEKVDESNALEILTKTAALCIAEKTTSVCADVLSANMQFKESQVWLDFKKGNRGLALEILDVVNDKLADRVKLLERQKCELDATCADWKRKCEEEKEKASNSKRRRK